MARPEDTVRPQDLGIGRLFENVRDAVIVADAGDGRIVLWNRAAAEVFGYSPDEALGMSVEEIVPERLKQRHRAGLSRYRDSGHGTYVDSRAVLDLPAVRKDGEEIAVELSLSPIEPLAEGRAEGRFVLAVVRDVTDRKRAEEKLRQTEARYRTLVERMPAVSYLQEIGGEESAMYMSPQIEALTGYSVEECRDPELRWRMVHPDDREAMKAEDERPVEPGKVLATEYRVIHRDGRTVWVRNESVVVEDEAGGSRYWQGFMIDITERKLAEEALKSSEEFFRALYEDVHHPIFLFDGDLDFVDVNPYACRFYGYGREEFRGMKLTDLILPEDRAKQQEHAEELFRRGGVLTPELRHRKKSGEIVTVTADADKIVRSGEELYVSKITDVTERKRAEEEIRRLNEELEDRVAERTARLEAALAELRERERGLREGKERYRAVVEQAGEGIFFFDPRTKRVLEANPAFRRMFGYDREELRGVTIYDLIPQDPEGVDRNVARALEEGYLLVGERSYRRKDGSAIEVEVSGSVISFGGEEVICSVVRDVTERKRSQEALRASEQRFRSLVDQSPLSIQILSPDGRTLRVNRAWEELFGLSVDAISGYNVLEDQQLVEKGVMPYVLKGFAGEPSAIPPIAYVPDETIPGASDYGGLERWVQAFIYPVKDDAGNVQEVVLMHEDVSERKRAEEALRESEERYRAVVEQAAAGIVLVDVETGRVLETNAVYEGLLGYPPEEMRSLTLYDLVPYPRESMDCYVGQVLESGSYVSGERHHKRKDGSLVDVEVSGSAISFGGRDAICMVIRDVTERKRSQKALQEVREAERKRMARDLHDGALQDLTYALAEAQILKMLSEAPSLDERINQQIEALRRTERGIRSAVYDLRQAGARDLPFPELLESLLETSRGMSHGCDIRLEVEEGFPPGPLGEGATELLRVVQEALSNARKHADARHVLVSLRTEGEYLVIEVSDDGRGFRPDTARSGVGLRSMNERIAALNGGLDLESEPGKGTRVRYRVPLRNVEGDLTG